MGTGGLIPDQSGSTPGRLVVARELLLLALGRRQRLRVDNTSMWPTLRPDDHLLVDPRAYRDDPPSVGDIVIARYAGAPRGIIVKRVQSCEGDQLFLACDNKNDGLDSRHFGTLPTSRIIGRVTAVI